MIATTRTPAQTIATCMALAFLVASALWLAMMVLAALELRSHTQTNTIAIALGPLRLHELSKIATQNGYTLSISFLPGIIWYCLSWLATGACVGFIRVWRAKRKEVATQKIMQTTRTR